jgi:hypothetical protein
MLIAVVLLAGVLEEDDEEDDEDEDEDEEDEDEEDEDEDDDDEDDDEDSVGGAAFVGEATLWTFRFHVLRMADAVLATFLLLCFLKREEPNVLPIPVCLSSSTVISTVSRPLSIFTSFVGSPSVCSSAVSATRSVIALLSPLCGPAQHDDDDEEDNEEDDEEDDEGREEGSSAL